MLRENKNLEYKRELSDTFLKTVSAFANYDGGTIVFGVDDDGLVVGVDNPKDLMLRIENKINTTINPVPEFSLFLNEDKTVSLKIFEGAYKPYLYRAKAYRRADSSTVEVSRLEYGRLVLEGTNQSFEQLPAKNQNMKFSVLEEEMARALGIRGISKDVLKTLELFGDDFGYNNAAYLIADKNDFAGVDAARFGENINEFRERRDFSGTSILTQFHLSLEMFNRWYRYEVVKGSSRSVVQSIPEDAFRESLANALVHRTWDVPAPIRISMYDDRLEVVSPGGLPSGISVEEYLDGKFSLLRNPILAGVFFRLGYIEKFGTGITRIKYAYRASVSQPQFVVRQQSVTVVLPTVTSKNDLEENEQLVLGVLEDGNPHSRTGIQSRSGLGKDTTIRALNSLLKAKVISRTGAARSTTYKKVNAF
uniref:ATP-binding protein n=1 Tax=Vaginimicrobium propionicum TaxID=1871034 RepID=UPI0018D29EE2|nr:ATP-binding protein [Vaginimicrobium propionicum]